jgi:hypothetical protein
MDENCQNNITITPMTSVPNWGGEGMEVDINLRYSLPE